METDKPAAAAHAQVKALADDNAAGDVTNGTANADDAADNAADRLGRLGRALTIRVAPRLVALALGAACILMGLNAALLRLNLPAPIDGAELAALHGPTVSNGASNPRTTHSHRQKLHRRPGSASSMKFR